MHDEPDLAHFHSIPWCATLLSSPNYHLTPTFSRQYKASTEDSLIAESLKTHNTISHCLSLYTPPDAPAGFIEEVRTLVTLGSGMNGGANVLHGGMVATLMDDVMGTLLTVNKEEEGGKNRVGGEGPPLTASTVTASLEVKYLRPVRTPGTVCVVARCRERKGRRFYLEAEVRDGEGNVAARGVAVWVRLKSEGRL